MRILRSELLKLTTIRMPLGLLIAGLLMLGLILSLLLWGPGVGESGVPSVTGPDADVDGLLQMVGAIQVFAALIGVIMSSAEYRHGTAAVTFLATPRREQVVLAKVVVALLVGLVFAVAAYGLAFALLALAAAGDGGLSTGPDTTRIVGLAVPQLMLLVVLGVGIGALVRSQVVGIVAVLLWSLAGEAVFSLAADELAKWLPMNAATAMTAGGSGEFATTNTLDPLVGAAVLTGWALLFVTAGVFMTRRRDVG